MSDLTVSITYGSTQTIREDSASVPDDVIVSQETGSEASEEFSRFEEFTRKIVAVPKDEIDDQRRKP